MNVKFVCSQHKCVLEGEPIWSSRADFLPDENELPDIDREVLMVESVTWLPDTSNMSCPQQTNYCQLKWSLHFFGDDGCWLTYSD